VNAERLGTTIDGLIGKCGYDFLPPDVAESRKLQVEKVVHTGQPVVFEDVRGARHLLHSLNPVKDSTGKVTRLAIFAFDMTERKKAQEALREAEQKWRCLAENAPDVILTADPDGTIIFMNRTVPPYTPEEAIGTSVYDYVLPEYRDVLRHALEEVVRTSQSCGYELAGAGPDGRTSWYQSRLGPIKQGGQVVAITLIATDVTERKQAEDALRQSEIKYRTLLENLTQKVFLKDRNSVYISCNENYARDLRIKADQIAGKTDYDFYPRELAEKYRADDKRIIESGQATDIEEKYILEGQEFIVHTVKTPVRDEQGNVTGILGIFWDITESKQQERELNLYREKMAQAERLASLGTLSATVAHELTQPLTTIRLSIENSLAQLEATSCPGDILEELKDGLDGVSDAVLVVDRVRNFARQSSEKAITEVNLREVAERIARLLDKNARQANISVQLKDLEKLPPIYARERDMEQLFFALADNAIHAADGKRKRQLSISGAVKGDHIELRFADNCDGIAPENLDKIFEPFFTTRPAGEGTGLGLPIVQHIVSRAGGKVWVENKPGKGATFFVALPIGKTYESLGR
jgi:PAS domain S-box-containing protein